jgi:hypothetical protein
MRYLRGTSAYGLHYTGYLAVLEGYSESNWISDAAEIKATSGYIVTIGGATVPWRYCKHTTLTKSTMEVGLVALESATTEAEWLKELLMDLPMVDKPVSAIILHCDNQSVIIILGNANKNAKFSRRCETANQISKAFEKY